jgi:hypothetical protein
MQDLRSLLGGSLILLPYPIYLSYVMGGISDPDPNPLSSVRLIKASC